MPSIDGLVTGIDSAKIIEGLLAIRQRQIDLLESKRQRVLSQKTALQGIEARMLSFRSVAAQLGRAQNSVFEARTVTLSDSSFVAATATSKAAAGVYQIRINSLARAHQIAAQGYADADAEVTQGTLEIRVGNGPVTTITIDGANNTLQGVADAINASAGDVSAAIVRDGSGGSTPYRLILSSRRSGADHQISIINNLAATSGGATRLEFDLLNPIETASDASVSLGTGPGAITITSDTNRIENLLGGITLDLLKADPAQQITLTVAQNVEPAARAVQDFVDAFNGLMTFIDEQVRFDSETQSAGILLGNRSVLQLQDEIRRAVVDVVPGVGALNRLSAIGISVTDKGQLRLNASRLNDVLNGRVAGVTSQDVMRLFALAGQSDHPQVQFLLGSSRTKASSTPYGVDVTQAAERASITATSALADAVVIDASNRTLGLTIDGASLTELTLAEGTYTRLALAEHLQAVINASPELKGRSVSVGLEGDSLRIISDSYGASSQVTITGGTALSALGFAGTETDQGLDVVGSFVVNGELEAAVGRGRVLSGNADNPYTADLQVRVTLSAGQLVEGIEASLTVTRGVAARLDQILGQLLDSTTGRVKQVDDRFDETAADIQKVIDRQNARFEAQQASLIRQFAALESAVSELQSTSNFLSAQLASLAFMRPAARR